MSAHSPGNYDINQVKHHQVRYGWGECINIKFGYVNKLHVDSKVNTPSVSDFL